jgi:F5/8 type C domain-containing protein/Big-like domain-containing protein
MRIIRNHDAKNIAAFSAITILLLSVAVTSQFASPRMVSAQIDNKGNPPQTVTQNPGSCVKAPINAVSASGSDNNRKNSNNNNDNQANAAIDNNPDTKWSDKGLGSFLQTDLGSSQPLCSVQISWDKGDKRSYNFVISVSNDGFNFEDKFRGSSKGTDPQPESYDLPKVNARYVRVTVYGNSDNNSAGITEIAITRETNSSGEKDVNNNSCTKLGITGFKASPNDAGNIPANTIDDNLNTRWSSFGVGSFIQADLGSIKTICSVGIAWYNGDVRQNNFVISVSKDGTSFSNVFSGTSSGQTTQVEPYDFNDIDARYVKITVNGNTQNNWASITELAVFGFSPVLPPNHAPTVNNIPDVKVQITRPPAALGSVGITLSGQDIDNDALRYEVVPTNPPTPTKGNLISTGPNTLKYTLYPATQNAGKDSFIYRAIDARGLASTNVGAVNITISEPPNNPPVVDNINNVPVQITTPATPVSITLVGRDADGDQLTFTPNTQPTKGTVAVTGNIAKYTLNSNIQADTTDSFTYTASDGKAGGVSNIGTVTLQITGQSQDPGVDKFGIKKIYPTKSVGGKTEEWYMNMDNPTNDPRTSPPSMSKNSDGSWKVTSGQVRYGVYTSTGYHPGQISTLNQKQMEAKGYMQSPNDWKNVEMTGIVKMLSGDKTDQWTWYGRGGRHTGNGYPLGCEGTALKPMLYYDGKVRFAKEQWHVSYVFTGTKSSPADNIGKFVGFKSVMYNFQQGGNTVVKLEIWVDLNPDSATGRNKWQKVNEFVDSGGWGSSAGECGGKADQIITWGGPTATFRWDNANNVSIKNFSVREIVPPQ